MNELAAIHLWDSILKRTIRTEAGCWQWTGPVAHNGYGLVSHGNRSLRVPRVALAMKLGRDLIGLALHTCDNPRCCNPDHLFEGSHDENRKDAIAKGRSVFGVAGQQPWRAVGEKVTPSGVRAIRAAFKSGTKSVPQLAREYNLSETHVDNIVNGRRGWEIFEEGVSAAFEHGWNVYVIRHYTFAS